MSETPTDAPRRTRVLIADDTESVRALFRNLLVNEGFDVIAVAWPAAGGTAVVDHIKSAF